MATRLLERVPMDRIGERARPVNLAGLLVRAVVGVFYLAGWITRREWAGVGMLADGAGWAVAAVVTGWQDAGMPAEERRRARAA